LWKPTTGASRVRNARATCFEAHERRDDRAHEEHIHVHEVVDFASREAFIRDVASSHDGGRSVRDEELVVHPVVEPSEDGDRREILGRDALSRTPKRVEQAYLHVRERRLVAKHRVAARRIEIVHEQPHPHAAQRGATQVAHRQPAGSIVLRATAGPTNRKLVAASGGPFDPLHPLEASRGHGCEDSRAYGHVGRLARTFGDEIRLGFIAMQMQLLLPRRRVSQRAGPVDGEGRLSGRPLRARGQQVACTGGPTPNSPSFADREISRVEYDVCARQTVARSPR